MDEKWRSLNLNGFIVEVSDQGNVRNTKTGGNRKFQKTDKGLLRVGIRKKDLKSEEMIHSTFLVHRLVLYAFVGIKSSRTHLVNWKNGNRTDNRLENLEYVPRHATPGPKVRLPKRFTEDAVRKIRVHYDLGVPLKVISELFSLTEAQVAKIGKRETWNSVPDMEEAEKEKLTKEIEEDYKDAIHYFRRYGIRIGLRNKDYW